MPSAHFAFPCRSMMLTRYLPIFFQRYRGAEFRSTARVAFMRQRRLFVTACVMQR